MEIQNLQIEFIEKNGFVSNNMDNIRHIKSLPFMSIAQAVKGSYDFALGDSPLNNTGDGGFFIAPANLKQTIIHHNNFENTEIECRWIFFKVIVNSIHAIEECFDFPQILPEKYKTEMNSIFNRFFLTDNKFEEYTLCCKTVQILSEVMKEKEKPLPKEIEKVIDFIKTNYQQKITVDQMARICNMSSSYFFSFFKKYIGVSPINYVTHYRLSVAENLLCKTNLTVSQISKNVGIDDPFYFNKKFKQYYNLAPTKFRKTYFEQKNQQT